MKEIDVNVLYYHIFSNKKYLERLYIQKVENVKLFYNNDEEFGSFLNRLYEKLSYDEKNIYSFEIYSILQPMILSVIACGGKNVRIDWDLNFRDLKMYQIITPLDDCSLTLEGYPGVGGAMGPLSLIEKVKEIFNYIIKVVKYKEKIYQIMEEHSQKPRKFIKETILLREEWPFGFISTKYFKEKNKVEHVIMWDLGYKKDKNKKCWKLKI